MQTWNETNVAFPSPRNKLNSPTIIKGSFVKIIGLSYAPLHQPHVGAGAVLLLHSPATVYTISTNLLLGFHAELIPMVVATISARQGKIIGRWFSIVRLLPRENKAKYWVIVPIIPYRDSLRLRSHAQIMVQQYAPASSQAHQASRARSKSQRLPSALNIKSTRHSKKT